MGNPRSILMCSHPRSPQPLKAVGTIPLFGSSGKSWGSRSKWHRDSNYFSEQDWAPSLEVARWSANQRFIMFHPGLNLFREGCINIGLQFVVGPRGIIWGPPGDPGGRLGISRGCNRKYPLFLSNFDSSVGPRGVVWGCLGPSC